MSSEAIPPPASSSPSQEFSTTAPSLSQQPTADQPPTPVLVSSAAGLGGPSLQRVAKVYASTAEAIAHFKPTSREVISGIAPHVFDERKRRRSPHRASKPYWYSNGQKRSSPLRGATIISWDEHTIYLEQPDTQNDGTVDQKAKHDATPAQEAHNDEGAGDQTSSQRAMLKKRAAKLDKSGWRYFRVDIRMLKSVVEKLKPRPLVDRSYAEEQLHHNLSTYGDP